MTAPALSELAPLVAALGDGNASLTASIVAEAQAAGVAPMQLYSRLFAPAMARVGEMWECGELSIAQEHVASSIMERVLAANYPKVFVGSRGSREQVLLACVSGERHTLALQMCRDLLEGAGYRVTFMGADTPKAVVLEAAERYKSSAIVLSAEADGSLQPLIETIEALHQLLPPIPILTGGAVTAKLHESMLTPSVTVLHDIGQTLDSLQAALSRPAALA